eukprot:4360264-Pyramimonas_sp.AAC.1
MPTLPASVWSPWWTWWVWSTHTTEVGECGIRPHGTSLGATSPLMCVITPHWSSCTSEIGALQSDAVRAGIFSRWTNQTQ